MTRRIFVFIPNELKPIELQSGIDFIFDIDCYEWIKSHNIEDYKFIDLIHEGNKYKLPITNFCFMY